MGGVFTMTTTTGAARGAAAATASATFFARVNIDTLSLTLGSAGRALGPQPGKYFVAWDGFKPAAFLIVIAAIERFPREGEILKEICHHVFHQLIAPAACVSRHLLKFRLYFRGEMHFHGFNSFSENTCCAAVPGPGDRKYMDAPEMLAPWQCRVRRLVGASANSS
jgi:hypothetical protein